MFNSILLLGSSLLAGSLLAQLVAPPPTRLQGHMIGATLGNSVFLVYPVHYGPPQRRAAFPRTGDVELHLPYLTTPVPASLPWQQGAPAGGGGREPEEVPLLTAEVGVVIAADWAAPTATTRGDPTA
jgi:hypothetical protein